jgi:hypothetical protein
MTRTARLAGMLLQGLVLGAFLFAALVKLMSLTSGARIFRYQNF